MLKYEDLPAVNSERWKSLKDLPEEVWKDVPNYEGVLRVSNYARVVKLPRVHSTSKMILKQVPLGKYYAVCLTIGMAQIKLYIHRIVASAFINNPYNKPCIDHIDTNRLNNTVSNLQWVTHRENLNNPITKKYREQLMNKRVAKYDKIGNLLFIYSSVKAAAKDNNISSASISNVANGRYLYAGGYKWEYIKV